MKLIWTSLLAALILLVGYNFFLKAMPARWRHSSEGGSLWEQNVIKAQSYISMSKVPVGVTVGSSITERIRDLPPNFINFGLPGNSPFTGLSIILDSKKIPKFVLIETNVLQLDENQAFLDATIAWPMKQLRYRIPALMETSKPHHVLVRALLLNNAPSETPTTAPANPSGRPKGVSIEDMEKIQRNRMNELQRVLSQDRLDNISRKLHFYVDKLTQAGATVVFFEAPEYAPGFHTPWHDSIRARVRAEFPESKYAWVPDVDWNEYQTTDAVHLDGPSAAKYSAAVREKIRSLQQ